MGSKGSIFDRWNIPLHDAFDKNTVPNSIYCPIEFSHNPLGTQQCKGFTH
jgi:hypothetical protein